MKKIHFFYQNYNLSLASIKHVQITEEAFQLSKENIQQITNPDPDPLTRLNPDPIRIHIRNPVWNRSEQECIRDPFIYVDHSVPR